MIATHCPRTVALHHPRTDGDRLRVRCSVRSTASALLKKSLETYPDDERSLLGDEGGPPPSSVPPERIRASGKVDLHKNYTDFDNHSTVTVATTRHCASYRRRLVAGTFLGMSPPHLSARF